MSAAAVGTVPVEQESRAETTPAVRVYGAHRGWRVLDLTELWEFRELLYFLIWRDVKVRYKQTALGAIWAVLQPAMYMVLFTVIFGRVAHLPSEGVPYPLFVFAGLLPWTFVANAVTSAGTSLVNNANLITKVYFPRFIIPLGAVGAGLLDLGVGIVCLAGMLFWYHVPLGFSIGLIPVILAAAVIIAVAAGTMLAALTVTYRDFRYVVPFGVQMWMYASPIVYPAALVPTRWRWIFWANPMAGIVEAFRHLVVGSAVDWAALGGSVASSSACLLIAAMYFARTERRFVDIV